MVSFEASCESIHGFQCAGNGMAMPRRAMKDLGFQACCLRCDAPDIVGGERCRSCIKHHTKVRDLIAKAPQSDELFQLARELLSLAAEPHKYDHDEVHGQALRQQQRLANSLVESKPLPTNNDIEAIFAAQSKVDKSSPIQNIANQNPWKDELPPEEVLDLMAKSLEPENLDYGARTVPSKPIASVDRSERLGEDRGMIDRIEAEKAAQSAPEALKDIVESATISERERSRKEWESAKSDITKLLDDDLDL
jgi:hypothetical protein